MKQIFSCNKNIDKNAYLNFRTYSYDNPIALIHNMNVIAEGFRDSAFSLVKIILKDNIDSKADNLIFPILFNTNHSIEVYLKTICWAQNLLLNKKDTFEANHNLNQLFTNVVNLEYELNSVDKEVFFAMLSNLKKYIAELYDKIERTIEDKRGNNKTFHDITFCRYSLNNDLEPQFYINTIDNVVVDLENFLIIFEEIFKNLNSLYEHYTHLCIDIIGY